VALTQAFDLGASVVNRIVAISGPTGDDREHVKIATTSEDLSVARPPVVLGFRSKGMVAGWHERPVDDPRPPSVDVDRRREELRHAPRDVSDDAMGLRPGDHEHSGELAHGQVRAQARTSDDDASLERQRPWPTATRR
jgi:hypothetical protein